MPKKSSTRQKGRRSLQSAAIRKGRLGKRPVGRVPTRAKQRQGDLQRRRAGS
jgi:hypothetical protein